MVKLEHIVKSLNESIRFNTYCEANIAEIPSRKGVKKAIERGELLLNGQEVEGGRWLKEGDIITWVNSSRKPPKTFPLELKVLFEDHYLAVIEKPAGFSVSGNQYKTIYNALGHNLKPSSEKDALPWPLPAHRLDNPTRGLLIIAKTTNARIKLGEAFEQKTIQKTYHALVVGKPEKKGELKGAIDRKKAHTKYELIDSVPACKGDFLSLLKLHPLTGRTHQLRKHCAGMGTPILGDAIYGKEGLILKQKGLFLAATGLLFQHPINGKTIHLETGIPEKQLKRLAYEERRYLSQNKSK